MPKEDGPIWDVTKTYHRDLRFMKVKFLLAWTIYFHIKWLLLFNRILLSGATLHNWCHHFARMIFLYMKNEDDQLRFCFILMLNTALKTSLIADHAETSTWRRNLYVIETDLFVTSLPCLIGRKIKPANFRRRNNAPIDTKVRLTNLTRPREVATNK